MRTSLDGVPSPKSHFPLMSASPNFEPRETIKIWLIIIKVGSQLFYAKIFAWLVLKVWCSFLFNMSPNTSLKPRLQKKVLPCRHPCHSWDPVWSGKSQPSWSQWLRLHGLTSSDFGLRTWASKWTCPKITFNLEHSRVQDKRAFEIKQSYWSSVGRETQGFFSMRIQVWSTSNWSSTYVASFSHNFCWLLLTKKTCVLLHNLVWRIVL